MIGAAEYGTARSIPNEFGVGGKTGSCISKGTWVGLFASVAPVYDPEYAVVVITRGKSARGKHSAAIAGKIYEALRTSTQRTDGRRIASADKSNPNKGTTATGRDTLKRTASSRPTQSAAERKKTEKAESRSVEELFPTIVIIKGKPEVTRPRVISNRQ